MGIGHSMVEAIIREHRHKPILGDVVMIGRQTVYFTPEQILELLKLHAVPVSLSPSEIELDKSTQNRPPEYEGSNLITDTALFRLLGAAKISALDHSDYEGAEIIHDLTKPLPDKLRNQADFIVDGSTLDNVFNPALAIKNLAELLRPGGRLLSANVYSNHSQPYTILTPLWFIDYCVMNGFVDCKLYIIVYNKGEWGGPDVFCLNLADLESGRRFVSNFSSPHIMGIVAFAEKGPASTTGIFPAQQHYRSSPDWAVYRQNLKTILQSRRPHLVRSAGPITYFDVTGGHLFVDSNFTEQDPLTEIRRHYSARIS